MWIEKFGRFWKLYDYDGNLVCVTVYKCGALEVAKRLGAPFCAQVLATGAPRARAVREAEFRYETTSGARRRR